MRFGPVFIVYILIASMIVTTANIPGEGDEGPAAGRMPDGSPGPRAGPVDENTWPMLMGGRMHHGYSSSNIPLENTTDILWGQRITSLMGSASPVIHDGVVYIGSGNGYMRGYDMDTGEEVWGVFVGNHRIRAAGAIDNGRIFFGADNGHLYGFEILTGTKILDLDLQASEFESSPLVAGDRIFIGAVGAFLKNHRFHAVDISEQRINWTLSMGDRENYYGFKETAAYKDGMVYIGDGNGTFYCLDEDGFWDGNDGLITNETNTTLTAPDLIWKKESDNSVLTDPLLAEGNVYYGDDSGRLNCLNATTGEEVWSGILGRGEQSLQACPTYKDGRVYLSARYSAGPFDGASVYSLDPMTGSEIWRFNITGQIITGSSPIIANDHLVFGSRNGKIYCISTVEEKIADEDRIKWTVSTGSPVTSTPAVAAGRVFVSNEPLGSFGKLFAIGAPDPSIQSIWLSDPSPYVGESVDLMVELWNNATVDAYCDIEYIVSTFNNSKQMKVGTATNVLVHAGESTTVSLEWIADTGYDFVAARIKESTPEDRNTNNNLGSLDLNVKTPLSTGWTSVGSGPGRTSGSGQDLESNRSFWELDLQESWSGGMGPLWYDEAVPENGSLSSSGAALYMVNPSGDLVAINSTPDESGVPGYSWIYSNSSVDFTGKPVLLIEKDRAAGGPNRVFANGDDGALWAFDWLGFRDGFNDGDFQEETSTGSTDGDVVWRTEIASPVSGPMLISGGSVIVPCSDGRLRGVDDDEGTVMWARSFPGASIASDSRYLYVGGQDEVLVIDPNSGDTIHTMEIEGMPYSFDIRSLAITGQGILVSTVNGTLMLEEYPVDGIDSGFKDNSTSSDILWYSFFELPLSSPPAVAPDGTGLCVISGDRALFLHINNGTEMQNITLPGPVNSRPVSGGGSYYIITGSDPWTMRAYSPAENGLLIPTWNLELDSEPMGEMVIVSRNMFIALKSGRLISLGANNNNPDAVIASPEDGILVFPDEVFTLDASGSSDLDGDPLNYVWFIEGETEALLDSSDPTADISLDGMGRKKLILRVYDDMGAFGETYVNVTVLKRITGPDFNEDLYDINVHMSYGISEPSGRGIVSASVPEDLPDDAGSVFTWRLDFDPWPEYAEYRFEWANVSIEYADKEFKQAINEERMGLFYYDKSGSGWMRAPISGITNDSVAYGNFSSLRSGFYAIGILDNTPPELRHREVENYRYRELDSVNFKFRVEYRDEDNDLPSSIQLVIDNKTYYDMIDEGFATTVTRWSFFSVSDVSLEPGSHTYFFTADDGNFMIESRYFSYFVPNTPPVADIVGPTSVVRAGDVVLFDGSGSYDPDGSEINWSWDFNDADGIQKDKVGPKADHIFIEEGNYVVTLTVSDKVDKTEKTLRVTVIDPDEDSGGDSIPAGLWILILVVIGILILAIIIFIVISKKGHEEEIDLRREYEGTWICPECGNKVPNGIDECPNCDYIHDPLDFEDDDEEVGLLEDFEEM